VAGAITSFAPVARIWSRLTLRRCCAAPVAADAVQPAAAAAAEVVLAVGVISRKSSAIWLMM